MCNCEVPPSTGAPSPQPLSSGVMLNKGSSNVANHLDTFNVQYEQKTSSLNEDASKDLQKYGKRINEDEGQPDNSPSDSSSKRSQFVEDFIEDEDHFFIGHRKLFPG